MDTSSGDCVCNNRTLQFWLDHIHSLEKELSFYKPLVQG
jgi:hypothetical protein